MISGYLSENVTGWGIFHHFFSLLMMKIGFFSFFPENWKSGSCMQQAIPHYIHTAFYFPQHYKSDLFPDSIISSLFTTHIEFPQRTAWTPHTYQTINAMVRIKNGFNVLQVFTTTFLPDKQCHLLTPPKSEPGIFHSPPPDTAPTVHNRDSKEVALQPR